MTDILDKCTEYLSSGGLFNPELMEHDKVRDLVIECRDEIERLREKCDKQAMILRRLNPESFPDTLFIHSYGGERDNNGLPQYLHVVPAYGCDWSQVYEKTARTVGPEW